MEIKAKLNHLRISARKARLVAQVIKGLPVKDATSQLVFIVKQASKPILKLLNSTIANAEHNFKVKKDDLYVKNVIVNQGSTLKRMQPRAFGRAYVIRKRSCHISLILTTK